MGAVTLRIARENGATLDPKQARELAGGSQVLAVDPGISGAAVLRLGSSRLSFRTLDNWEAIAGMVAWSVPLVILLEDQFCGADPAATKEVSFVAGAFVGYLAAHGAPSFTIVHVMPGTWQAAQRFRLGLGAVQLSRADGLAAAVRELSRVDALAAASVRKNQRDGFASALGILLWWEGLLRCKQ